MYKEGPDSTLTIAQTQYECVVQWLNPFGIHISDPLYTNPFDNYPKRVYVFAYKGEEIVGYASTVYGSKDLIAIFVAPDHRMTGVGRTLLDSLDVSTIIAPTSNVPFRDFVEAIGFKETDNFVKAVVYRRFKRSEIFLVT